MDLVAILVVRPNRSTSSHYLSVDKDKTGGIRSEERRRRSNQKDLPESWILLPCQRIPPFPSEPNRIDHGSRYRTSSDDEGQRSSPLAKSLIDFTFFAPAPSFISAYNTMIPFYKAFSLVLRVFSRPLLAYTKRVHSSGEAQSLRVRVFFVRLGNFYHKLDSAINRRFLKVESQFAFKPLND